MSTDTSNPEARRDSLALQALLFLGAPAAWVLHLMVAYALIGIRCNARWSDLVFYLALAISTVLLAAAAAFAGAVNLRRVGSAQLIDQLADDDEPPALLVPDRRARFLHGTGALMAAIFTLLIIMEAIVPLLVPVCAEVLRLAV